MNNHHHEGASHLPPDACWNWLKVPGSFSQRILGVLSLVLAVAFLGSALGVWSLQRVSEETGQMVDETMATERLVGDLRRHIVVNVARSKAFALSSEPQVGDALTPEIEQTSALVDQLLQRLSRMQLADRDRQTLRNMSDANTEFLKARQELTVARDGGLTSRIEQVHTARFTPAATVLLDAVDQMGESQRARIDASVAHIGELSLSARQGLVLFGLCALLLGGVLAIWLVRGITRPIQRAVDTANRVAALDLTEHIEGHERDEAGRLLAALGRMQRSLHTLVAQVQGASHSVAEGAIEMAAGNLDFSIRTEQSASSLQQTAASVEQITATMQHSLQTASHGDKLAQTAASHAAGGGTAMADVMRTMVDISDSSRRIMAITTIIDELAFQTNTLALNTAIEAAHAGREGRGLAVVATEVRALAQRSRAAAGQIKSLVTDTVDKVQAGSSKVRHAHDSMSRIIDSVGSVAHAIGEIAAATREQSTGMSEINSAVSRLDQMTQQNAAAVEQSSAAAHGLQEQARKLRETAARFRLPCVVLALR
jgi:methyl-accepting chemotaxis protein